tara:strand:- start:348 stop:512 length:165 start_codon:yes stop_codon:yes gene_type:complete
MKTSSQSFKIGFTDYQEGREADATGIESPLDYFAGYRDAMEQDAMEFDGANDHA